MVKSSKPRQMKAKAPDRSKRPRSKPKAKPKPRARGATARAASESRIARNLVKLQANPGSAEILAQAQLDIEQHGLKTFFQAVALTPAGKRVMKEEAQQARLKAAHPRRRTPAAVAELPAAVETETLEVAAAVAFPGIGVPAGDVGQTRQQWLNCIGSQVAQPLRLFRPTSLSELRSVIQQAEANRCTVKAVGSGHSFTDVALTTDFLIDTRGLCRTLPLEEDVLKSGVGADTLFATEGGIVVRDLNEALWEAGLGLINMGGYDGQTIMGVVSTSTHGSGISFGPLASFVASLTMVVSGARALRIEPRLGITDPAKWAARHPDIELIQDDDWFNACQVGIGCLGVVYSIIMHVMPRYWMKEERTLSTWQRVKQDLQAGQVLENNRHYEVLVNPYLVNGDHTCLITRRNPVPEPDAPPHQLPRRNFLVELIAKVPGSGAILLHFINRLPELVPKIIDSAMQGLARDYVDRSYRVFNIGAANDVPAYGSEIGFPAEQCINATERILKIAADGQRIGNAYLTSPFSLRFVKASEAFMSMMHGTDTCMIEFPMLDNTIGGKELLRRIETEMYAFGGRPHWGLLNFLACDDDFLRSMYPQFDAWLSMFRKLNPTGLFDNAFTDRCGISTRTFVRN